MNGQLLFNADKIVTLEYKLSQRTAYRFLTKETNRYKTIFGIKLWRIKDLPDRWSEYEDPSWNSVSDSNIRNNDQYIVQDLPKMVFYKPWVRINFNYKHYIFQRFDSDEKMLAFIEKTKDESKTDFSVINN